MVVYSVEKGQGKGEVNIFFVWCMICQVSQPSAVKYNRLIVSCEPCSPTLFRYSVSIMSWSTVTSSAGSCFPCLEPWLNRSQHRTYGMLVHVNNSVIQLPLYQCITLSLQYWKKTKTKQTNLWRLYFKWRRGQWTVLVVIFSWSTWHPQLCVKLAFAMHLSFVSPASGYRGNSRALIVIVQVICTCWCPCRWGTCMGLQPWLDGDHLGRELSWDLVGVLLWYEDRDFVGDSASKMPCPRRILGWRILAGDLSA